VLVGARAVAEAAFEEVGERVTARLTSWVAEASAPRVELLLVQGLPQPRKVDEIVEKGTEVGIDSFLIVPAVGSPRVPAERVAARLARWRTVAREAAKQSRQLAIPEVRTAGSLQEALALVGSEGWRSLLLTPGAGEYLGSVLAGDTRTGTHGIPPAGPPVRWALWVGPEGGWSSAEVEVLTSAGCLPATLGSRVLRTETAGTVAGALARYALSDW